jgi:hypothetical protein
VLTAASRARMIVPPLALVVAGCAVLPFVVSQVRREPVATASAGSLAASQRSSDAFDEFATSPELSQRVRQSSPAGLRQTQPWSCCTTITCVIER